MTDAPHIVLTLPEPPSANRLKERSLRTGQHYHRREYDAWLQEAGWLIAQQRAGDSIPGNYRMRITAGRTRKDLDNLVKGTSDGLKAHHVITDDRLCDEITLRKDRKRKGGTITVELWAVT